MKLLSETNQTEHPNDNRSHAVQDHPRRCRYFLCDADARKVEKRNRNDRSQQCNQNGWIVANLHESVYDIFQSVSRIVTERSRNMDVVEGDHQNAEDREAE